MACEIISVDGAVFVLWGQPTKADLDKVVEHVELTAQRAGKPIVFIARIPKNAPAPEGEARAHMNALMPRFVELCSSYQAVLEGSGFVSAIKRAVLTSLLQFGFRKGTFFVHESTREIPYTLERDQRAATEAVLALAAQKELLTAQPPTEPASGARRTERAPRSHARA